MDVDEAGDTSFAPLPTSGGIQDLREKLHARMNALRRGGGGAAATGREGRDADADAKEAEAGSKDELLEERRKQRALLRERRRKETKEKIRKQEEERGRKGKGRERDQGKQTSTKVSMLSVGCEQTYLSSEHDFFSPSSSFRNPPHRHRVNTKSQNLPNSRASHLGLLSAPRPPLAPPKNTKSLRIQRRLYSSWKHALRNLLPCLKKSEKRLKSDRNGRKQR